MEGKTFALLVHEAKEFYVGTQPKVASSWISDFMLTHRELSPLPIRSDYYLPSVYFNQINLSIHKKDRNVFTESLEKDWYSLLSGGESSKEFIFFLRNPVNRFLSVIIKDVLLNDVDVNSDDFLRKFDDYENKEDLNKFIKQDEKYRINQSFWWSESGDYWNEGWLDGVIRHWVDKTLSEFFKSGFNLNKAQLDESLHNLYLYRTSNIYLYHKILFNSNIDSSKIKILDIDRENLFEYFSKKCDLQIDKYYNKKINDASPHFKNIVLNYLQNYDNIIESILREDALMYIDIIKKVYGLELDYDDVFQYFLTEF